MNTSEHYTYAIRDLRKLIINDIIEIFKSQNITSLNLLTDKEGRNYDDDNYNDSWVNDHRVWVYCRDFLGGGLNAIIKTISIQPDFEDGLYIMAEGDENCEVYTPFDIELNCNIYIAILEHLEQRFDL